MNEPSPTSSIDQVLKWILTEIGAGMCLIPKSVEEHAWNNAHERCRQIINNYRNGDGLFQMVSAAQERDQSTSSTTR